MAETHSDTQSHIEFLGATLSEPVTETASPEQETGTETPSGESVESSAGTAVETQTTEATQEEVKVESVEQPPDLELQKLLDKKGVGKDKFEEYAKRFGLTNDLLKENPSLKHLVFDKIASDDAIAKLTKPKEEVKPAEQNPPADVTKHFDSIVERASKLNDPKALGEVAKRLAAIPNDDPQYAEKQLGVLAAAQLSFMETALPQMFQQLMQSHFGGLMEQNNNVTNYRNHEKAYNDYLANLKDEFPNLPAFGSEGYAKLGNDAKLLIPNIESAAFTPEDRMKIVLNLAVGRKVEAAKTKEVVTEAAESGRRQATQAQQTAALGKGLGAGQSNANAPAGKKESYFSEGHKIWRDRETNNL